MQKLFTGLDGFVRYSQNQSILDIGCGGGTLVRELTNRSLSVVGLDLYLENHQKYNPLFIQADAYRLPWNNPRFDMIFAFWSIFHYEPLSQFGHLFKELSRVLQPGGSIWIPALNDLGRVYQIKVVCRRLGLTPKIHVPGGVIEVMKLE